jgi:hypothetical protein
MASQNDCLLLTSDVFKYLKDLAEEPEKSQRNILKAILALHQMESVREDDFFLHSVDFFVELYKLNNLLTALIEAKEGGKA